MNKFLKSLRDRTKNFHIPKTYCEYTDLLKTSLIPNSHWTGRGGERRNRILPPDKESEMQRNMNFNLAGTSKEARGRCSRSNRAEFDLDERETDSSVPRERIERSIRGLRAEEPCRRKEGPPAAHPRNAMKSHQRERDSNEEKIALLAGKERMRKLLFTGKGGEYVSGEEKKRGQRGNGSSRT